jgi:sigma-B regulation protein RsbU (phosphoserine phosphatase)
MPDELATLQLRPLDPISGGVLRALRLASAKQPIVLGRSEEAQWRINDPAVSRQHASVRTSVNAVYVRDLGSRHGTFVNSSKLIENEEVEIRKGDVLSLGSWRCILDGLRTTGSAHTIIDNTDRIQHIEQSALSGLAQIKLDRLLAATRSFAETDTRTQVADVLIQAIRDLRGCQRAFVVRQIGEDEYEVISSSIGVDELRLSRSLIKEASAGRLAQLLAGAAPDTRSHSLIELDIQTALCAPVIVSGQPDCYLYVDSRGGEDRIERDAPSFCHALIGVAGLAIERILGAEMEQRRQQIELDLKAARHAQQLLFPAASGNAADIDYVFESIPGRLVGGDLFDFITTDSDCSAFFLGDATGKGVGAGMHMVATQTQLRTLLMRGVGLAEAINETNLGLISRTDIGKFITLMAGIWNPALRTLELCDAGHGFCIMRTPSKDPHWFRIDGSVPLGVDQSASYPTTTIEIEGSTRLILVSDGVVEQANSEGIQFGIEQAISTVKHANNPAEEVTALVQAVRDFANGPLSDDLSVASIQFGPES